LTAYGVAPVAEIVSEPEPQPAADTSEDIARARQHAVRMRQATA